VLDYFFRGYALAGLIVVLEEHHPQRYNPKNL
jgi:hypothetical protein